MEMLFAQTGPLVGTCKSWELGALSSWGPLCTCDLAGCICRFSGLSFSVIILGLLVIFNFPIWFEITKLPNQEGAICILRDLERWRRKKKRQGGSWEDRRSFSDLSNMKGHGNAPCRHQGSPSYVRIRYRDSARETRNCHREEMAIVGLDINSPSL